MKLSDGVWGRGECTSAHKEGKKNNNGECVCVCVCFVCILESSQRGGVGGGGGAVSVFFSDNMNEAPPESFLCEGYKNKNRV